MPEIKEIGVVIASREMTFEREDGQSERAYLRVGTPFEYGDGYDWCCPYELGTESVKTLNGAFGVDSLQALELTMKTLRVEIDYWEKARKGKFHFLGEEGAGI